VSLTSTPPHGTRDFKATPSRFPQLAQQPGTADHRRLPPGFRQHGRCKDYLSGTPRSIIKFGGNRIERWQMRARDEYIPGGPHRRQTLGPSENGNYEATNSYSSGR